MYWKDRIKVRTLQKQVKESAGDSQLQYRLFIKEQMSTMYSGPS